MFGRKGLDINVPDNNYTLKSLPGKFSGLRPLATFWRCGWLDSKRYWHDQQWAAKALAAHGDVDGYVHLIEGLRSRHAPNVGLSALAE